MTVQKILQEYIKPGAFNNEENISILKNWVGNLPPAALSHLSFDFYNEQIRREDKRLPLLREDIKNWVVNRAVELYGTKPECRVMIVEAVETLEKVEAFVEALYNKYNLA